ncbi:aminodeoxychorismate/anthranilate synthase component II [Crocinitomicaceae bacterium CZZ-1]|uniref:Aminodeoxychorismate/anthranilate synthase component II n=1 Tax=Taishania pollutisoli TaxID=2766479 RepID=A0A8J6PKF9_9FLAO|nr:aminodeoxychorismate/anthranilate synthase component II [Taishania pollutisoli]MBC9813214.1 aminodeoxychorismate/anthranilate synthase component II [Taishania pollutisoli]MBX2950494.1 aminodeoxychorismate/anthranilate synthase component II [Crocinitomicaceae bacterium]NGF76454.1 aminodeoxychorismate/anthranilate synthase component II [Fluviicola sp. SGL-29]
MKVLIVDNYDSFTYNLYHYAVQCGVDVVVRRNDELLLDEVQEYDRIILSPGPGLPSEAPLMFDLLKTYGHQKPILGVCLGMQGIAEFYGGQLINQKQVKHGVQADVTVDNSSQLFKGLPPRIKVGLYHSWCVDATTLPDELKVTGISSEGVVMSFEHIDLPVFGVQFHPESVMTEAGLQMLNNYLK